MLKKRKQALAIQNSQDNTAKGVVQTVLVQANCIEKNTAAKASAAK
tara:strand:- start:548 stop:685 length:138 start_codon:yes stop_codon:yes gene_type:complete